MAVKEKGDDIVFLRKIVKGGADRSYGIQVARLAGVPDTVLNRAREIADELVESDITSAVRDLTAPKKKNTYTYDQVDMEQMSLFDTVQDDDIIAEIRDLDVTNLTPMDALNILYRLQNKIKTAGKGRKRKNP